MIRSRQRPTETSDEQLLELLRHHATPLPALDDPLFAEHFDQFADARVVLIGEASHGTSEFYRARAQITRRLVERHGFNIIAAEADWPDAWRQPARRVRFPAARRQPAGQGWRGRPR